jgi:small-conductance mechanosensitive channel
MIENWLGPIFRWVEFIGPNPFLQAVVIVLAFLVLGKLVDWLTGAALDRVLIRWDSGGRLGGIGHTTLFRTIALLGLLVALEVLPTTPLLTRLMTGFIMSLLVLVWVSATIRAGVLIVEATSRRASPPPWARPATVPLFNMLLRIIAALVGMYLFLLAWGVNVTGLVASAGILGLALSFAAQDTLGNLFAGVAILIDQPYRIDDYIVIDTGERGRVTHIGLRSTRLLTRDDEEISIPNGIMGRAKIVNESGGPHVKYRLRVPIGVAYGSDIDQVISCLMKISSEHPNVCRDPEPRVRLRTFSDSKIEFELLVWIAEPVLRGLVLHELNCELYRSFAHEGIAIPFPQRDLHIKDWRTASSTQTE